MYTKRTGLNRLNAAVQAAASANAELQKGTATIQTVIYTLSIALKDARDIAEHEKIEKHECQVCSVN